MYICKRNQATSQKNIMQLLQNCIGPTIRIAQESWCLTYAGFFKLLLFSNLEVCKPCLLYFDPSLFLLLTKVEKYATNLCIT